MATPILFVLFISRDNRPLYIQPFVPGDAAPRTELLDPDQAANEVLKYNFLSHTALDTILLPLHEALSTPQLLFIQDLVAVYGCESNTGLKIVVGTLPRNNVATELQPTFLNLHREYVRLVCNPFLAYAGEAAVDDNPRFDKRVQAIVDAWNTSGA